MDAWVCFLHGVGAQMEVQQTPLNTLVSDGGFWRKPSNRKCPAVSEVLPLPWINADSAASGSSTVAVLGPETGALI